MIINRLKLSNYVTTFKETKIEKTVFYRIHFRKLVHYANIRYERCQKLPDRGGGGSFNFTAEGSNPLTLPELSEADMHPPKNRYSCRVRGAGQVKKHSIPPELKNNITSNNFFVQKIYFQVPKTK